MLSPLMYSWSPSKQFFLDAKTSLSPDVMGVLEVTGQIGLFVVIG